MTVRPNHHQPGRASEDMSFPPESVRFPPRFLLDGVPQVRFYDGKQTCPEDAPFPACLKAFLEFVGDDRASCEKRPAPRKAEMGCPYAYAMGTSGVAFFLSWGEGWHPGNVAFHYLSPDPEAPYRQAFKALGYSFDRLVKGDGLGEEELFRARIKESLVKHGIPVFACGVIGPPEPCLITGYDEDGAVLIGWNFFQNFAEFNAGVEYEPAGPFRKRGWFADTDSLVITGVKQPAPAIRQVLRDSLVWALEVMRNPMPWPGRHNGLAAYEAWAKALLWQDESVNEDMAVLRERFIVHDEAVGTVAEGRWYGAAYLRKMISHVPEAAEPLTAAARRLEREHDLMWEIWNLTGGLGRSDDHVKAFAPRETREEMARIIREAQANDREVTGHFEKALALIAD